MVIDCDTCAARGPACRDCVVTAILQITPAPAMEPPLWVELDEIERDAVDALAAAGLVPPLRLVSGLSGNGREIA